MVDLGHKIAALRVLIQPLDGDETPRDQLRHPHAGPPPGDEVQGDGIQAGLGHLHALLLGADVFIVLPQRGLLELGGKLNGRLTRAADADTGGRPLDEPLVLVPVKALRDSLTVEFTPGEDMSFTDVWLTGPAVRVAEITV